MIDYPDDHAIQEQAKLHGIPPPVLIRDLVRIVEALNLRQQGFFNKKSVLAGSMALRCLGSPRFTVYDADFSTTRETVNPETAMKGLLAYEDDDLSIIPSEIVPNRDGGAMWKSAPIDFVPAFTSLAPDEEDRNFKADISFRGLIRAGIEVPLSVPYDLGIWSTPPGVFIMDPIETTTEKILGWCVHGQVKHYADLAYLALKAQDHKSPFTLNRDELRQATAEKLEAMTTLQPDTYAAFPHLEDLIGKLEAKPVFDQRQWESLLYVREARRIYDPVLMEKAIREHLVPLLK